MMRVVLNHSPICWAHPNISRKDKLSHFVDCQKLLSSISTNLQVGLVDISLGLVDIQ